jgi:hypothetical protein
LQQLILSGLDGRGLTPNLVLSGYFATRWLKSHPKSMKMGRKCYITWFSYVFAEPDQIAWFKMMTAGVIILDGVPNQTTLLSRTK